MRGNYYVKTGDTVTDPPETVVCFTAQSAGLKGDIATEVEPPSHTSQVTTAL